MQDILDAHAQRVRASNDDFAKAAEAAREAADAAARAAIAEFGATLVEIARDAEQARKKLADALEAATARAQAALAQAFDANVAELALSTAAAQDELAARSQFLTTGRLPSGVDPLPRALDLHFRDSDPPSAELIVLDHKPSAAAAADAPEPAPTQTAAE